MSNQGNSTDDSETAHLKSRKEKTNNDGEEARSLQEKSAVHPHPEAGPAEQISPESVVHSSEEPEATLSEVTEPSPIDRSTAGNLESPQEETPTEDDVHQDRPQSTVTQMFMRLRERRIKMVDRELKGELEDLTKAVRESRLSLVLSNQHLAATARRSDELINKMDKLHNDMESLNSETENFISYVRFQYNI